LIGQLGWPDPLSKQAPRILLCGTASPSHIPHLIDRIW
jgi:hypothetical protein